jgi:hypothetical protein
MAQTAQTRGVHYETTFYYTVKGKLLAVSTLNAIDVALNA